MDENNGRAYLEAVVGERARHMTAEEVRTTCSFARAERLLGREYHGRFLIELLQNAADAWRSDPRSERGRSRVAVVIGDGPSLLVANQGSAMSPAVVIESLGHIGASNKPEGEAIGHKGIGFKSVLEVTHAPEIYSGLRSKDIAMAVAFNPAEARDQILKDSPRWDEFLPEVQGLDLADDLAAIPILRFPRWVEAWPRNVAELAADGFDTVVRLPFKPVGSARAAYTEERWLETVRCATADLSDQILVLLGSFSEVRIVDRLASTEVHIRPEWEGPQIDPGRAGDWADVRVLRNGSASSSWKLVRRTLPAEADLAGEVVAGLRVAPAPERVPTEPAIAERLAVVPAVPGSPSAPFHLFFPTRIASGLPFLLHGYFEVDAARTGFYRGSADRNKAILAALTKAAVDLVCDAAHDPDIDLATLVNLIADCNEPEDELAQFFRREVLKGLDDKAWIPVEVDGNSNQCKCPDQVFVARTEHLARQIARVFPPQYVLERVSLWLPDGALSESALRLIRTRPRTDDAQGDFWETLSALLRPADRNIWTTMDQADAGFLALLDLLDALRGEDPNATEALITGLQGDPASRLLPTIGPGSGRQLLPIPNPAAGVAGQRSALVMARIGASDGEAPVPPQELDLAFLPEGLLASDVEVNRARALGIRPFTVDTVLDRLNGIGDSEADPPGVIRFLWHLLARARVSGLGTKRSAEIAAVFDPTQWFWCRPDRARDETGRARQQRERYLSEVKLPARDGTWRSAGSLAFGEDWADWLESTQHAEIRPTTTRKRAEAYRALEAISPGPDSLLAPPATVLGLLDDAPFRHLPTVGPGEGSEEAPDVSMRDVERHAFLLRLGVWEVPPIAAWSNWSPEARARFPWTEPMADHREAAVVEAGGWTFGLEGWGGKRHNNVYLAEDFRFAWPLQEAASRNARALAAGLCAGHRLYADRLGARLFCPGCSNSGASHRARRESNASWEFPSVLALELRHEPWLECVLDGVTTELPAAPVDAWWREQVPTGAGLRQSPWRLLPMCSPATGVTDDLRRLIGVNTIEDADLAVVTRLLRQLRDDFVGGSMAVDPSGSSSARQAFVTLHRLAYEHLAELAGDDPAGLAGTIAEIGVLCELGDRLAYRAPAEARHDDGRFATYVRYFAAGIPFIVLPRPQVATARSLGVQPFAVDLTRDGEDDGLDVTDDLHEVLGDRIPELLAIVVNHSLGGQQTLELDSEAFAARSRRLQSLNVRQVPDLVIHASVEGTSLNKSLGQGSYQDIYIQNPTSAKPVLFHDLNGDGWQDRLRRKIAPHLAAVLENGAYADIFALFLLAESDGEREEFLLERGITGDDVDAVAARIGVVGKEEQARNLRWYQAVLKVCGSGDSQPTFDDPERLVALFEAALAARGGHDTITARALVEAGGGEAARRDTGEGSPLRILLEAGVDLADLDRQLRLLGDTGLAISVTRQRFARWLDDHGRRVVAVLATRHDAEAAKSAVREVRPPDALALCLEPPPDELLQPVAALLSKRGFHVAARDLAYDPATTLARLGNFASVDALDSEVLLIFNEEEQRQALQVRASQWRREIRLIAVLSRMGPTETRSNIRALDEESAHALGGDVFQPSDLTAGVEKLFANQPGLRDWLIKRLDNSIRSQAPDRDELLASAAGFGVDVNLLQKLLAALDAPRRRRAREIMSRSVTLRKENVVPRRPDGLVVPRSRGQKPLNVAAIKVDPGSDRRKRELGDEGEQWALASVIGELLRLSDADRGKAIDAVCDLLGRFDGSPVRAALVHAELARSQELDDEELVDELTGLLHVSRHSDAFGFDLIGWFPKGPDGGPRAVCLEVKSSGSASFKLSSSEWARAEKLHADGVGDQYAVLVVRRSRQRTTPKGMDLLADPVSLRDSGLLSLDVDGWTANYRQS